MMNGTRIWTKNVLKDSSPLRGRTKYAIKVCHNVKRALWWKHVLRHHSSVIVNDGLSSLIALIIIDNKEKLTRVNFLSLIGISDRSLACSPAIQWLVSHCPGEGHSLCHGAPRTHLHKIQKIYTVASVWYCTFKQRHSETINAIISFLSRFNTILQYSWRKSHNVSWTGCSGTGNSNNEMKLVSIVEFKKKLI